VLLHAGLQALAQPACTLPALAPAAVPVPAAVPEHLPMVSPHTLPAPAPTPTLALRIPHERNLVPKAVLGMLV